MAKEKVTAGPPGLSVRQWGQFLHAQSRDVQLVSFMGWDAWAEEWVGALAAWPRKSDAFRSHVVRALVRRAGRDAEMEAALRAAHDLGGAAAVQQLALSLSRTDPALRRSVSLAGLSGERWEGA